MEEDEFMLEQVKLILKGGAIGVANIIPGVSGGTMAVVLGVYQDLVEAIGNFVTNNEKRREYTGLLLKIALGAISAVLALSWLMDFLLSNYPKHTYLFFVGLIIGSIPSIYRAHEDMVLSVASVFAFLGGILLILAFAFLFPEVDRANNIHLEYQITMSGLALLLLGGVFAGGSMIIPGISGSFVLVLLGQYGVVIKALKEFNFVLLGVVAVGATIGVWGFAKIINFFFKVFPKETLYFILGLIIASLYPIFPGLPEGTKRSLLAILLAFLGVMTAYILGEKG